MPVNELMHVQARMEEEVQKATAGVAANFQIEQLQASLERAQDVMPHQKYSPVHL